MKRVRAGLADRLDHESTRTTIFGRVIVHGDVHLLNGVRVGSDVEHARIRVTVSQSIVHVKCVTVTTLAPSVCLGATHQAEYVIVGVISGREAGASYPRHLSN